MRDKTPADTADADISSEEVQRRIAVLKRFRELLSQQRERFAQYLEVLDKQQEILANGNADALIAHVELEEKIVSDIFAIQKVIDPLNDMYQSFLPAPPGTAAAREEQELPGLKTALEELKKEAIIRSGRNRKLLADRMEELRLEIKNLRSNPYALRRSVYSGETPSLVDITG